jgi:hypothetical protein
MAEPASNACVIAGRYLASPAALRTRPEGPIEALDTRSGRAAQVRIVFASEGWDEDGFAESVSRWCALGCAEICGALDFGEHEGRRFLVVPPSLGMSIERWRATRRPGPAEAARLTLAFGRLAERVAAAGFPVDAAELADFAVGPGPTPFLERPLLGSPDANPVLVGPRDGQRTLARIFRAALADQPPEPLAGWLERAADAGFTDLAACLDQLEQCGDRVRDELRPQDESPVGLEGLFDERAYEAELSEPLPRIWPRRLAGGLGLLAAVAISAALLAGRGGAAPALPDPTPRPVAVDPVAAPVHQPARHVHRRLHVRHRPRPHTRPHAAAAPPPPAPPAPAAPSNGVSRPPSQVGVLPDPGDVDTLPAP